MNKNKEKKYFNDFFSKRKFTFENNFNYIGTGCEHSYYCTSKDLYFFGSNKYNQLGNTRYIDKTINKKSILRTFSDFGIDSILKISTGGYHTLILLKNKKTYSFGKNLYGQCAQEFDSNVNLEKIKIFDNDIKYYGKIDITNIKCGLNHTIILTSDGRILTFGLNEFGQLGNVGITFTYRPTYIDVTNIQDIYTSNSSNSNFIVTNENNIFAFGENQLGHLGVNKETNIFTPTPVIFDNKVKIKYITNNSLNTFIINAYNDVYAIGIFKYNESGLLKKKKINVFTKVFLKNSEKNIEIKKIVNDGRGFIINLFDNFQVWGVGFNEIGQLGIGNTLKQKTLKNIEFFNDKKIIDICCGVGHSLALSENGDIYGWGFNKCRQLGINSENKILPIKIGNINISKCINYFFNNLYKILLIKDKKNKKFKFDIHIIFC